MSRTRSHLKAHRGALVAGLVLAAMTAAPMPMWGHWNGTNPVWTNSNVGIGTASPDYKLVVNSGYALGTIRIGAEGDYLNRIKSETHLALQTVVGADLD